MIGTPSVGIPPLEPLTPAVLRSLQPRPVGPSVRSNLTTILGRTAAYSQREITWEDMMRRNEAWDFPLDALKA